MRLLAGEDARPFVIAEIGINHDGDSGKACELIARAIEAGADAIKTQVFKPEDFPHLARYALSQRSLVTLASYAEAKNILFFGTPDDCDSADLLIRVGARLMKTGSQSVTDLPLLDHVGRLGVPILYSTGMATEAEVAQGYKALRVAAATVIPMHCVSAYPAPVEQLNLRRVAALASSHLEPVGFSDHSLGYVGAAMALALGARIFEKHFTLDPCAEGPDHAVSVGPAMLADYIDILRQCHAALGDGSKQILECERATRAEMERRIARQNQSRSEACLAGHPHGEKHGRERC